MGRLSSLKLLFFGMLVAGCEKNDAPLPPTTRSEAILTSATPVGPTTAAPSLHRDLLPARKLCETELTQPGHDLPRAALAHAEAPGAAPVGDHIPTGGAKWTWINFFAAWCGPCREEIPRLKAWEQKLQKAGTPFALVFVSLDDDDRQLGKFLDAQPLEGLRAALWLKGGAGRDAWLGGMKMKNPPDLPQQALVDPNGQVRCLIQGAVSDSDFPQLAAIVRH